MYLFQFSAATLSLRCVSCTPIPSELCSYCLLAVIIFFRWGLCCCLQGCICSFVVGERSVSLVFVETLSASLSLLVVCPRLCKLHPLWCSSLCWLAYCLLFLVWFIRCNIILRYFNVTVSFYKFISTYYLISLVIFFINPSVEEMLFEFMYLFLNFLFSFCFILLWPVIFVTFFFK